MPGFDPHLWRQAGRISGQLARLQPRSPAVTLDQALWSAARNFKSRLDQIHDRNWHVAVRHLRWQFRKTLERLHSSLGIGIQRLTSASDGRGAPSQQSLYEELLATREEFEDFESNLRQHTLSVTTPPIFLEEISLGRFRITLDLRGLSGSGNYTVTAETPCYSAARSDICHPHVNHGSLCEGTATEPLRAALQTGRLSDFFQIIQQTLLTYNAESAYSHIEEWEERTVCHDCGDRISTSDCQQCPACDSITCDGCCASCPHCGDSLCGQCIQRCRECDERVCPSCNQSHYTSCSAAVQLT